MYVLLQLHAALYDHNTQKKILVVEEGLQVLE